MNVRSNVHTRTHIHMRVQNFFKTRKTSSEIEEKRKHTIAMANAFASLNGIIIFQQCVFQDYAVECVYIRSGLCSASVCI